MSCSAKKNKKNLDSTYVGPHSENSGASPYLCILILSHIFHDCFVLSSGWVICHTKDRYIYKDDSTCWLLAYVNGLCTHYTPLQDVPLLLLPPLNFRQVREKLAMQFLCICNAYSPSLQNTCCHVLKRRTRKTKFEFQVLLLITAFDIHPVRCLYRTS